MSRMGGGKLTLAALVLLAAGTSCRSVSVRSAETTAPPASRAADAPSSESDSPSFSEWERTARREADRLLDQAQGHAEEGRLQEAEACVDDALRTLLDAPPGYPVGVPYLDELAAVLDDAEQLAGVLSEAGGAAHVQDADLVAAIDVPDDMASGPEPPSDALPASDFPLVVNGAVETFLDAFTRPGEFRHRIESGLERAGRYLPMIRTRLAAAGLPQDLAYLPLIESAYSETARSRARAAGMWQFVAGTARHYGLAVNALIDERIDAERATEAAVAHLADLHTEFGDWNLALAAYNSGAGNVRRALRRAGAGDFWSIRRYLPRETRNYVPAFIAAVLAAKQPSRYGLPEVSESEWQFDSITVPDALDLDVLARELGLSPEELRQLNPAVRRGLTPAGTETHVRLPAGLSDQAAAVLARLPRDRWAPRTLHTVRSGESLSVIARRYGSTIEAIRAANGLHGSLIRPGQNLVVPRFASVSAANLRTPSRSLSDDGTYVVRSGDSLWSISRSFGVALEAVCAANGLERRTAIMPGQRLHIPPATKLAGPRVARDGSRQTYRVRPGDTLFDIARRFGTTVEELRRRNDLTGSLIQPGDVLQIPSPRGA